MSSLIKEILDMVAVPFRWLDENRCIFSIDERRYGIYAELLDLALESTKSKYRVANIAFGLLSGSVFTDGKDLDLNLTNFGKPRTVLSTVAEACLNSDAIVGADIISLAGADSKKKGRVLVYSLALSEIRSKDKRFSKHNDIDAVTSNGAYVTLLSKISFTDEEKAEITDKLGITK